MGRTLEQIMESLPEERRKKIEAGAQELLALHELREAAELTQVDLAKLVGLSQSAVSQLEKKGDARVSTLSKYVQAIGGQLELVVKMPNGATVSLRSLKNEENDELKSAS
ncbi:transcriptional regulator [Tepidicaulis marinus]|uniref:Transcriptional regulator n=2 Tax=Tepidicaulis marinus TaxID=1333998 RepID=A0A081BF24_9HYPH|nr:transcriptional regulator [Tepidicaulis marinus]